MIRLPERVDAASAEARYEDGVLTLRFRKAEEAKPKQITIS
jgi:HSP20 family molecular chaperone IbpA